MLRDFLRDSALYFASVALSRGIAIILIPLYTRFLRPAEYGALDLLIMFATLANYLVALEISQGMARVYAEAKTTLDKRSCVSSAVWFAAAAYGVFIFIATPFSALLANWLLGSEQWQDSVRAMIFAVGANGIFFLLQDLLRWQLQPLRHAAVSVIYSALSAAVGAFLVIHFDAGVAGIVYGQIVGAFVGVVVAWYNGAALHWQLTFQWARWREMVSYSAPQVISSFAAYFSLYIDRLLIKEFMTLEDVGVYGVGARIASVVALLMAAFQLGYTPVVFQNHAAPDTPPQMARVFRYFMGMALALLLLLSGFSKELLWLFATVQYSGSWNVIPLLAAAMLLANMFIFVPGIFIARRTDLVAAINVGTAVLNVGGNYLLIPIFGLLGAAAATFASSLVAFSLYVYCNQLFYPIPFDWRRIAAAVMLGTGVAAILFGLQILSWSEVAAFALKIAAFFAGSLAVAATLIGRGELALGMKRVLGKLRS